MRAAVLAAGAALVMLSAPASAAPDRTVRLSGESRTASWTTDLSASATSGVPAAQLVAYCSEAVLDCDETVMHIAARGALTIAVTRGGPVYAPYMGWSVRLYRSDATGKRGAFVDYDANYDHSGSTTIADLTPGHYLAEISWGDGVGELEVTASLQPTKRSRRS